MAYVNFDNIHTNEPGSVALLSFAPHEVILNFGELRTDGELSDAVLSLGGRKHFKNFGDIVATGAGSKGVTAIGDYLHIDNFGSISTSGTYAELEDGAIYSDGIFVLGDESRINNHGVISIEGFGANGIFSIGADATIINFGSIVNLQGDFPSGILAVGDDQSGTVVNQGEISLRGFGGTGIYYLGLTDVKNAGSITIDSLGGAAIYGGGSFSVAENTGKIIINGDYGLAMLVGADGQIGLNRGEIVVNGDSGGIEVVDFGGFGGGASNEGSIKTYGMMGFALSATGDNAFASNSGTIVTHGILAWGMRSGSFGNVAMEMTNSGSIVTEGDGSIGIQLRGADATIVNDGSILTGGGVAIVDPELMQPLFLEGPVGAAGVAIFGNGIRIDNLQHGTIEVLNAQSAAVTMNDRDLAAFVPPGGVERLPAISAQETSSALENWGNIVAPAVAVLGGAGQETVVNYGHIKGDVVLEGNDDTFVAGNGSHLDGTLSLGDGNDFVFVEENSGLTIIDDFCAGPGSDDIIDLSAFFANMSELLSSIDQIGDDAFISCDAQTSIILKDVLVDELDLDDFIFGSQSLAGPPLQDMQLVDVLSLQLVNGDRLLSTTGQFETPSDADLLTTNFII